MTMRVIELLAVVACNWFTGAAIYITAVEHPARLSCGTDTAVRQWAPSYKRATVMQASLAVIAGMCGLARGATGGGALWVTAAILILLVVPFTLIVVRPTNNRLLDSRLDRASEEALTLLRSWGRLHAVRTVLATIASLLLTWAVSRY